MFQCRALSFSEWNSEMRWFVNARWCEVGRVTRREVDLCTVLASFQWFGNMMYYVYTYMLLLQLTPAPISSSTLRRLESTSYKSLNTYTLVTYVQCIAWKLEFHPLSSVYEHSRHMRMLDALKHLIHWRTFNTWMTCISNNFIKGINLFSFWIHVYLLPEEYIHVFRSWTQPMQWPAKRSVYT